MIDSKFVQHLKDCQHDYLSHTMEVMMDSFRDLNLGNNTMCKVLLSSQRYKGVDTLRHRSTIQRFKLSQLVQSRQHETCYHEPTNCIRRGSPKIANAYIGQAKQFTQSLSAPQNRRGSKDRKEKNFLIMARVIDRTYRVIASDCSNLGLSQRCFRPFSVD